MYNKQKKDELKVHYAEIYNKKMQITKFFYHSLCKLRRNH